MTKQEADYQDCVRQTTRIQSQAAELIKLAQLRDDGDLSEAEFQNAKSNILT
ncbi:SHOCT domain-containing protein [Actinopolymorpha sp. NPDC004070]|uniref:SHOCT domain-containing protein n=1 Tax=Actinopolymorpha sp. NPDC004070 TaxID=3154548 RepID=UPI0033AAC2C1